MFEKIIDFIKRLISSAIDLLPNSPFVAFWSAVEKNTVVNNMLGYLNFFVPIGLMLQVLTGWLVVIVLYYVVTPLINWAKVVKS